MPTQVRSINEHRREDIVRNTSSIFIVIVAGFIIIIINLVTLLQHEFRNIMASEHPALN